VYAYLVLFHEQKNSAPFFETVIRYLGGLLSMYALSKDPILLARADDLGTALLPVFRMPSGLPMSSVNTVNGKVPKGEGDSEVTVVAKMLTCQLEYKYLSYLTGRKGYYDTVENIMDIVYKANLTSTGDLIPLQWSRLKGSPVGQSMSRTFPTQLAWLLMQCLGLVSVGALADSGYEYILKQWLLTGCTDTKARDLCALSPFFLCRETNFA
jgi:mannosyl-oligosaccharide alpha-1,2-mannosidase